MLVKNLVKIARVSGQKATDKTPMDEMPLIFVFEVGVLSVGESIFCIGGFGVGVLSLAFCPKINCKVYLGLWTEKKRCL